MLKCGTVFVLEVKDEGKCMFIMSCYQLFIVCIRQNMVLPTSNLASLGTLPCANNLFIPGLLRLKTTRS